MCVKIVTSMSDIPKNNIVEVNAVGCTEKEYTYKSMIGGIDAYSRYKQSIDYSRNDLSSLVGHVDVINKNQLAIANIFVLWDGGFIKNSIDNSALRVSMRSLRCYCEVYGKSLILRRSELTTNRKSYTTILNIFKESPIDCYIVE